MTMVGAPGFALRATRTFGGLVSRAGRLVGAAASGALDLGAVSGSAAWLFWARARAARAVSRPAIVVRNPSAPSSENKEEHDARLRPVAARAARRTQRPRRRRSGGARSRLGSNRLSIVVLAQRRRDCKQQQHR